MKKNIRFTKYVTIFLFFVSNSFAQGPIPPQTIVLEAVDTAAFAHASVGFDEYRKNIEYGKN